MTFHQREVWFLLLRYKSSTPTSQEHYLSVHELGIGNTKPFLFSELYNRVKALFCTFKCKKAFYYK